MNTESRPREEGPPPIPSACLKRLSVMPVRYLGGRVNQHWLVEASGNQRVLRRYAKERIASVGYEHEVLRPRIETQAPHRERFV